MGDTNRYEVRVPSQDVDVDFHREDADTRLSTWGLLYSAEHPWALEAGIELAKGNIMKMNDQSKAQLDFIRGFLFSNNSKVCNDLCWVS
jgi:hypothetical protein